MGETIMAEVYFNNLQGEPLRTISSTNETRLLQKAQDVAIELGLPVAVLVSGETQGWRVTPAGKVTRVRL